MKHIDCLPALPIEIVPGEAATDLSRFGAEKDTGFL